MLSKISNIASREIIETVLNAEFVYRDVYVPTEVINGLKESSVSLVTNENTSQIQFGIWGILPVGYENGWKAFQSEQNTLSVNIGDLKQQAWLWDAFENRRCLVISTGYYTSELRNSKLYPFQIHLKSNEIFCYAGIYNVLEDGFLSFTILSHSESERAEILKVPNPLILKRDYYPKFLNGVLKIEDLEDMTIEINNVNFISTPASRKIYKI
ncbi:MAG: SOS response-associated peptidase family protein [Gelidibacter sp.]